MHVVVDSVMAYKQRMKMGRFSEKEKLEAGSPAISAAPVPSSDVTVGARCEIESSEPGLSKRGTLRFVGETKFGTGGGVWVGIEYDEPFGKNDGS